MKKAVEYIISISLSIVLFIAALLSSPFNAMVTLSFTLLITVLTLQSITDYQSIPLIALQILGSLLFGAFSFNPLCHLMLSQVRLEKLNVTRLISPSVCWFITALICGKKVHFALLYAVVLILLSLFILIIEKGIIKYFDTKEKLSRSVSVCALGELGEKKLNEELRIKNYLSDRNARLEERENISRNIHNSVGHSITAAIMTLDAADMLFDSSPQKAREKMGNANERIRESLSSIRRAVRVLDSEDKPVLVSDICESIDSICKSFTMDTKITVKTNFSDCLGEKSIPSVHAEFFCSAVSELLSNGVRHGHADMFFVTLFTDSRHIQLTVTDNGNSDFSDKNCNAKIQNGFGLKKLISYCEKNGGSAVFSNPAGFKSVLTLPIIEEESYE